MAFMQRLRSVLPNKTDDPQLKNFKTGVYLLLGLFVFIIIVSIITFFIVVEGAEETIVPKLEEKELMEAILLLQEKNLYPHIEVVFSKFPSDKGKVIRQDPHAGKQIRQNRAVNLIVSKGSVIDRVGNYVGKNINEVKYKLETDFSTYEVPLLVIKEPVIYQYDETAAGTILVQKPEPDTPLADKTTYLELVVSKGVGKKIIQIQDYTNMYFKDAIKALAYDNIPFIISVRVPTEEEAAGIIVTQSPPVGAKIPEGIILSLVMTRPAEIPEGMTFGVFTAAVPNYNVLIDVKVEAINPDTMARQVIMETKHPGGTITVPYILASGMELILYIAGKETERITVLAEDE